MGDQPVTKIAALTATTNGLTADAVTLTTTTMLTAKIDNINNNNRRRKKPEM